MGRRTASGHETAAVAAPLGSLAHSIARGWRVIGTAISFATAGIVSLSLAFVVFPILRLVPGSREQSEVRAQYALHLALRGFVALVGWLGVMELRCNGVEKLSEPGLLVVANHPTLIDALLLMCFMPQADCVVKAAHYDTIWLAGAIEGAGHIPNRDGPQMVEECAERLRRGRSVLIFPEGTRSPKDDLGPFFRGAAHIALRAGCDPIPVTIHCEPATLYGGLAWWDVPERRFTVTLTVDAPVADSSLPASPPRAARALTARLRDHFERRLVHARDRCTSW